MIVCLRDGNDNSGEKLRSIGEGTIEAKSVYGT
jgi:hypothetical protein